MRNCHPSFAVFNFFCYYSCYYGLKLNSAEANGQYFSPLFNVHVKPNHFQSFICIFFYICFLYLCLSMFNLIPTIVHNVYFVVDTWIMHSVHYIFASLVYFLLFHKNQAYRKYTQFNRSHVINDLKKTMKTSIFKKIFKFQTQWWMSNPI